MIAVGPPNMDTVMLALETKWRKLFADLSCHYREKRPMLDSRLIVSMLGHPSLIIFDKPCLLQCCENSVTMY